MGPQAGDLCLPALSKCTIERGENGLLDQLARVIVRICFFDWPISGRFEANYQSEGVSMAKKRKAKRKTNPAAKHSKKRLSKKKKMIKRNNPRKRK
jgi:hypothetical protein